MSNTQKLIKVLRLPGDQSTDYIFNASMFAGMTGEELSTKLSAIEEELKTLSSFDGLKYCGTIDGAAEEPGVFTPAADCGDMYWVGTSGYIMGAYMDVGDILICNLDETIEATLENYTEVANNWDIVDGGVSESAILDHVHTITVTQLSSLLESTTVSHNVVPTQMTPVVQNGTASVDGSHTHTGSVSIDLSISGANTSADITPEGTVTLATVDAADDDTVTLSFTGTNNSTTKCVTAVSVDAHAPHTHEVTVEEASVPVTGTIALDITEDASDNQNYTPKGTIEGNMIVSVTGVDTTINLGSVSSDNASITPEGTVEVASVTAGGAITAHNHTISSQPVEKDVAVELTGSYSGTGVDGVLTLGLTTEKVTYYSTIEIADADVVFTPEEHTHTATFAGTAVEHSHGVTLGEYTFAPVIAAETGASNLTFAGTPVAMMISHELSADHTHTATTGDPSIPLVHDVVCTEGTIENTFQTNDIYLKATFQGKSSSHNHTFTGAPETLAATVTLDEFNGTFEGSAAADIVLVTPADENATKVLTNVSIEEHNIMQPKQTGSTTTDAGARPHTKE